jgi:hypothetical protein
MKQAAFWIHMRQDIHVALILECPISVDFPLYIQTLAVVTEITELDNTAQREQESHSSFKIQHGHKASTECAWSNKVIGLMCDVVNYCFKEAEWTVDDWSTLLLKLERWNLEKPSSFVPFFERGYNIAENRSFPEIYLSSDWHGKQRNRNS